MRRTLLCLFSLFLLAGARPGMATDTADAADAADTKRAFEIADLYKVTGVGVPEISPDGSRVVFAVTRYDLPAGERWSEIWTMAPDGSGLRQLTFSRHGNESPLFSPDGRTLLFTSDQSGESQLHLLPLDGGESRQLTHFPLGVAEPVWSPDGRYVAVTSRVYPECGADAKCNEKLRKDLTEGKLQVRVADGLLYRHWTEWRGGRYSHILLVDVATGEIVKDLTPGPWDSPVFQAGGGRGFSFSPDGKQLVYASNRDQDQASSTNADLWVVDVEGKRSAITEKSAVNLTDANDGWDGSPLYSPDGRYIAYRSQATPRYEAALFRLAVHDRQAKKTIYLTDGSNFDNWVDEMAWFPDSKSLAFQGQVQARTPLYRIGLSGGTPTQLLAHGFLEGFRVAPDGRSILYNPRTIASLNEIYKAPVAGGDPQRLTRFNAALESEVDIRPAEEMWVNAGSPDQPYKVHVFIIKPHDFDPAKKYPLILNVHGGPQSQYLDSFRGDWQIFPGKGYVMAFANPTGSTGYGQAFTDAIACDWGGRVYDDLMKVTDTLEKLPYVDRGRMGAMGWSFGGYMMMWFEGHTQRFKTLASMMGLFDLPSFYTSTEELWFPEKDLCGTPWTSESYQKWSPSNAVANFKTPALVITGENDLRVPYTQSLGFFTALQKQGVPSKLVVYPTAGHWPGWKEMIFYYNAHLDWFHHWLGGGAAPWDPEELARNRAFGKEGGWTKP